MLDLTNLMTSSLDIFIQFFTDTIEFDDYLRIKENINLNIMEILQET